MARFLTAHVINNVVQTISVWDHPPTEEELQRYAPAELFDVTNLRVSSGWQRINGEWIEPPSE